MEPIDPQEYAKNLVREYLEARLDKTDPYTEFKVFVVWYTYTLGNWKCMVSTTLPDRMYYEITHNTAKQETYLDAYQKIENIAYPFPG